MKTKYRWIMYTHNPLGGFQVYRVRNLEMAKLTLVEYCEATGFYHDPQITTGGYGCSGSLYVYSDEDWAEALEYAEIGCPFDYPSKLVERGPRGGVKVSNA